MSEDTQTKALRIYDHLAEPIVWAGSLVALFIFIAKQAIPSLDQEQWVPYSAYDLLGDYPVLPNSVVNWASSFFDYINGALFVLLSIFLINTFILPMVSWATVWLSDDKSVNKPLSGEDQIWLSGLVGSVLDSSALNVRANDRQIFNLLVDEMDKRPHLIAKIGIKEAEVVLVNSVVERLNSEKPF
ncbi:hypothetical protein [uncultured Marinobacter sp.]|uniref:hypothetical protein n=1 Tax=uncultured Marinobacter sp. TaxID=187379 RepID=UPI0030D95533|tara:strand:+ start:245 stop:802 length:558 start_codon:yes stop_codon:yes gene_type:complete